MLHFPDKAMTFHRDFSSCGLVSLQVQIKDPGMRGTWLLYKLFSISATCIENHRMFTLKSTSETRLLFIK